MNVTLARKEVTDLRRSRLLVALVGAFVLFLVTTALGVPADSSEPAAALLVNSAGGLRVISVVAILLGALAMVDEVETGRVRVLLGCPVTRRDVLLGKLLGRGLALVAATAVGFLAGGAVVAARLGSVDPVGIAAVTGRAIGFALAYFGIAFGLSVFATDRLYSVGGSFVAFLLFGSPWEVFVVGPPYWLQFGRIPTAGELMAGADPTWYTLLTWASPNRALAAFQTVSGPLVLFLAAVLAFWFVAPVAVGYWRFRSADIS
jgi:ABC-2 type transport system permease protein